MPIKKFLIVIISALVLVACKPATNDSKDLKTVENHFSIITPNGAPALSLIDFIDNEAFDYEVVEGSDVLVSSFVNADKDFIIAPANLGLNMINKNANYKLVSVITWGNLYLVGTNEHVNSNKIIAFGEMAVPGKVLSLVNQAFNGAQLEYYNSVQEVSAALLADSANFAVLAEPFLTITKNKWNASHENPLYEVYDMQELYATEKGVKSYPQAALFVKNDLLKKDMNGVIEFANKMASSITNYNKNSDALNARIEQIDLSALGFADEELIKEAYGRMSLNFVYAYDCVKELKTFLELFDMQLSLDSYIK